MRDVITLRRGTLNEDRQLSVLHPVPRAAALLTGQWFRATEQRRLAQDTCCGEGGERNLTSICSMPSALLKKLQQIAQFTQCELIGETGGHERHVGFDHRFDLVTAEGDILSIGIAEDFRG